MKDFLLKKMALPTIIIIWAASYYIEVLGYNEANYRLIQPVFWVMVLLYVINGVSDYREWKAAQTEETAPKEETAKVSKEKVIRIVSVIAVMAAYALVLGTLGFVISTFLFAAGILLCMGERKWYKIVFIPLFLVIALYLAFGIGLKIPLPEGFLGF